MALASLRVSAALLPSLPAVPVPLGVDVDRALLPLSLPLGSVLTLLLGSEHHVGEGHEHLSRQQTTQFEMFFRSNYDKHQDIKHTSVDNNTLVESNLM